MDRTGSNKKKKGEISIGIRTSKFKFNMREQLLRNR